MFDIKVVKKTELRGLTMRRCQDFTICMPFSQFISSEKDFFLTLGLAFVPEIMVVVTCQLRLILAKVSINLY